jgi:hypothetical protein
MAGLAIGNAYPGRLQQPFYPQQSRKPTTRTAHGHDRPPPDRARTTTATAHLRWIWLGHTQRGRDAGARPASAEPAAGTRGPVGSREMYIARPRDARAREGIRQVPSRLAGQAAASGWPWPCANAGPFCTFAPAYLATYSLQVSPWPRRGQASARARARAHA